MSGHHMLTQKRYKQAMTWEIKMNKCIQKKLLMKDTKKVILMMPDCPKMTDTLVEKAFKELDNSDFVLGPH